MSITQFIGTVAIWSALFIGILRLLDWLLSVPQKEQIADWSMRVWVWLEDQRLGKFVAAVRSQRTQRVLSVVAHISILAMVVAFLGRTYLGWNVNASLIIGNPRVYAWQVWVDVVALLLSMIVVTTTVHPRLTGWIGSAGSLPRYFGRALLCFLLLGAIGAIYAGLIFWLMPEPPLNGPGTFESRSEAAFGGKTTIIAVHALTAVIAAPVLAETLLLQFILFLSVYWLILIWLTLACHWTLRLLSHRIAEHKDGPILGLAALLVAIGAVARALAS